MTTLVQTSGPLSFQYSFSVFNCVKFHAKSVSVSHRKIIEFSSFTNDEKNGRGGGLRVTFHYFIQDVPKKLDVRKSA